MLPPGARSLPALSRSTATSKAQDIAAGSTGRFVVGRMQGEMQASSAGVGTFCNVPTLVRSVLSALNEIGRMRERRGRVQTLSCVAHLDLWTAVDGPTFATKCAEFAAPSAAARTGEVIGGEWPAKIGTRFAAVTIGRAAAAEAGNTRTGLAAIVVRYRMHAKATDAWHAAFGSRLSQQPRNKCFGTSHRLQGVDAIARRPPVVGRPHSGTSPMQSTATNA